MKQLQSPLLICLLFGFQAEILGQTGIDSLLRELKTLSNLKNVFLPPPDPMRPSLEFTSSQVVRRRAGQSALVTCVVSNQGGRSLTWTRRGAGGREDTLLTVNNEVVTEDTERVSVLHEAGGEVYVLVIRNLTEADSGLYTCQLNTRPPLVSRHEVLVRPGPGARSRVGNTEADEDERLMTLISDHQEHMTSCCALGNVTASCLGLCDLQTLFYSGARLPVSSCSPDLVTVFSCLADGRDHSPCCLDAGVPGLCTDLCAASANITASQVTSCAQYTAPILACVADGVQTIPKPPEEVSVTADNDTSVTVTWEHPEDARPGLRDRYSLNITTVTTLTREFNKSFPTEKKSLHSASSFSLYQVGPQERTLTINNLKPFTVYGVTVRALNQDGQASLPSVGVKVVTHVPGASAVSPAPDTDTIGCCVASNVTNPRCVEMFCDPAALPSVSLSDMVTCAPWATPMFSCLTDTQDHRPCCAARGLPDTCQDLCSDQPPRISRADFRYLPCFKYMPEIGSCLAEGRGNLPGPPTRFRYTNLQSTFVILHWEPPTVRGSSVLYYDLTVTKLRPGPGATTTYTSAQSPDIIENLEPRSEYEVRVQAVSKHGRGEPSSRLVFMTSSHREEIERSVDSGERDVDKCCEAVSVSQECRPLCSLSVDSDLLTNLTSRCSQELDKVLRCAAGGRDHLSCCRGRGVTAKCAPLCQGVSQASSGTSWASCSALLPDMFTCYEEGVARLPPPVFRLRAEQVGDTKVLLSWATRDPLNLTDHFEVSYKEVTGATIDQDVFRSQLQINTDVSSVEVTGLSPHSRYSFYVVSRNSLGSSLPSSVISLNISSETETRAGATSPPHLLTVEGKTTDSIDLQWNPPAIRHPEDRLSYDVHYRAVATEAASSLVTNVSSVTTELLSARLSELTPGTRYRIWVTCTRWSKEDKTVVESEPGEIVETWTRSLQPPYVQVKLLEAGSAQTGGLSLRRRVKAVEEAGSLTVLCVAGGEPVPEVSLAVNGVTLHSERVLLLSTIIHNITRDMETVTCAADNGVGRPVQAVKLVTVRRAPVISVASVTRVRAGGRLVTQCDIDAYPSPSIGVFRDRNLTRGLVGAGDKRVNITAFSSRDRVGKFLVTIEIENVTQSDGGEYFCHAENSLASATAVTSVEVRTEDPSSHFPSLEACCQARNVSEDCVDVCRGQGGLSYEALVTRPQCLLHYEAIIGCGAELGEARDPGSCCAEAGVSPVCLAWCGARAEADLDLSYSAEICAMTYAENIMGCLNRKLDNTMAPKNESGSSTLKTNESPSDERQTPELAGDTARDDETGAVISSQRGDNTDHSDPADTSPLIGVAIMCLLLTLGAVLGLFLKYRAQGLPEIVIRRPSLPGLSLARSPKQPGLIVSEALPQLSAASALENDNYHAGPEHLANMFSVSDDSEGSSSPGSGASPREQEERGRLAQVVDRLRSGLHSTSGFQRF